MSAVALARGVRSSWKPMSRMVVWQLQRTTTVPSGMRGISTIVRSTTPTSTSWISGATAEVSFIRAASSSWAGVGGKKLSLITPPHVRFATNAAVQQQEEQNEKDDLQEVKKEEAQWLDANNLEKSNYWGVTSKTFSREDGTNWPWHCFRPSDTYAPNYNIDLHKHREPNRWEEKIALKVVQLIKIPTVWFYRTPNQSIGSFGMISVLEEKCTVPAGSQLSFCSAPTRERISVQGSQPEILQFCGVCREQERYGCRAMMLETVAAVPGMVGGMLLHLRSLRRFEQSGGWIRALLDEAENERMHLMSLMELVQPVWYERALVVAVQGVFFNFYFMLYLLSPRLAHRVTGYLEEEAIISYTTYLAEIDNGNIENIPAPAIAIDYWRLPKDARLRDVIIAVRADEAHHRDVNHYAADIRNEGKQLHESPAPVDYH